TATAERRTLGRDRKARGRLAGRRNHRLRFEGAGAEGGAAGECRFGILIEGEEPAVAQSGALRLPIVGRIGIIVYVIVGDAKPQIEVFGPQGVTLNGRKVPALQVHNAGNAHARLSGFLSGTDAKGIKYDFNPPDLPILPGEVRKVILRPATSESDHPTLTFPVMVQGTLEWGNQRTEL